MNYLKGNRVQVEGIEPQPLLGRVVRSLTATRYHIRLDDGTTRPISTNHLRYIGRRPTL